MNFKIPIFIFLLVCKLFSQNQKSFGKIEYDMIISLNGSEEYHAELVYNNEVALYTYTNLQNQDIERTGENNEFIIVLADTIPKKIYIDREKNQLSHLTNIFGRKKVVTVLEEIPTFSWTLIDESRNIGRFICFKATTSFRGRNYTAWYCPEIQGSYGPWKLNGLPGLILEAYDNKKEVIFQAKKVEIPYNESITFDNKSSEKSLSYDSLKKEMELEKSNFETKMKSMQDRGMKISVSFNENKSIEIE